MQLITILTVLFPVASATPDFINFRPLLSHSLAPVPTQSDLPIDPVTTGPIPDKWRHTHGPLHHGIPSDTDLVDNADEPLDAIDLYIRLLKSIKDDSNAATTDNTKDTSHVALERRMLIPSPPMTNVEICQALCSTYDTEPCGPCEAVSNSPDATIPPPNAERTDTVRARALTTLQDKAWLPLWRCLLQCFEEARTRCDICNEYWVFYQSTLSLEDFQSPEMKKYTEMAKCLTVCSGGRYGPTCFRCELLWNKWERDLSPYASQKDPATAGRMAKRQIVREDVIGLTLYGCLRGCHPEWPENPPEVCLRCRKMVSVLPPIFMHNWATGRLIAKPEHFNELTNGPGPGDD